MLKRLITLFLLLSALAPASASAQSTDTNNPPTAMIIGPAGAVDFDVVVALSGIGSSDPETDAADLTYLWSQTGSPSVSLNGAQTNRVTFNAPAASSTLTFTLTVTDPQGDFATATETVNVIPRASFAGNSGNIIEDNEATSDRLTRRSFSVNTSAEEQTLNFLLATNVADEYGVFELTVVTIDTSVGPVTGGNWNFTLNNDAPVVNALTADEVVNLFYPVNTTTSDVVTVRITVIGANDLPTVNVNPVPPVMGGESVTLTSVVTDPDTDVADLRYKWNQIGVTSDTRVTLINDETPTASFTAPNLLVNTDLMFTLSAMERGEMTTSNPVIVTVQAGSNIPAMIIGNTEGTITAGTSQISGELTIDDPDGTDSLDLTGVTPPIEGTYGRLDTLTASGDSGDWSYTLENTRGLPQGDATRALAEGAIGTDSFLVLRGVDDESGVVSAITITVIGVDDTPTVEIEIPDQPGTRPATPFQEIALNAEITLTGIIRDDIGDMVDYEWVAFGALEFGTPSGSTMQEGITNRITTTLTATRTGTVFVDLFVTDDQSVTVSARVLFTVVEALPISASLIGTGTLTEANLFAATAPTITVQLRETQYVSEDMLLPEHFTLNHGIDGIGVLTVTAVSRDSDTEATLTLAYDGVDITSTSTDLSVVVAAAAHTNNGNLTTTNTIQITPSDGDNICGRTPQVRDAILAAISPAPSDCTNVPAGLPSVTTLDLSNAEIDALQRSDFAGLTALASLNLSGNRFTADIGLPVGVFDDVLDTLDDITDFTVDPSVRNAHFVCSHAAAAAIVALTAGVTDCLRVSSAQFNDALPLLNDATLSQLTISAGALDPAFDPGTTTYTATVPNSVDSVTVTPTATQTGTTITVNANPVGSDGSARITLTAPVGTPEAIAIAVTAADTTTTQTLHRHRHPRAGARHHRHRVDLGCRR